MKTPEFPYLAYCLLFIGLVIITIYNYEYKQRMSIGLVSAASEELNKIEELLSQMMPPHVLKNLEEEVNVVDKLNQVTIMYADIAGFTAWSAIRDSKEVVGMLSELFTRFDKMCIEFNVYKVHTIGDCYVAMGYTDKKNRNPAKEAVNVLNFARSLISVIEETNEKCECKLGMRIGIHTGEVIGGITGTKIVRYDIYGPDALIANKMESNGEEGKITLSESTKTLLDEFSPGKYMFTAFKEAKIVSLGKTIKMFLVTDSLEYFEDN